MYVICHQLADSSVASGQTSSNNHKQERRLVLLEESHKESIILMFDGTSHLLVSSLWSDSPQNRFFVSFYEDDMSHFVPRLA
jgi:hypothetical protein